MSDDQIDLIDDTDDLGWILTPNAAPEKLGRARKRRLRAEIVKWRDWYRRHGQEEWVRECDANLARLDSGEYQVVG